MTSSDEDFSNREIRVLKHIFETDGLAFMRYFFKLREGSKLIVNWHHHCIDNVLQKVLDGEITRLIINVPPGYTKTEMAVINFIARGLAINPRSKYIHTSYSADLALQSSSTIKDTIKSAEYSRMWPVKVRVDTKSKRRWFTQEGGGVMAASSGGQITGFRAGRMEAGFTGAFVIDDPIKPEDAFSTVKRERVNSRFNTTTRSRLANESVPIFVIMQRTHEDDLSGYLLRGGSGEPWHHLNMPARFDEVLRSEEDYDKQYTHGIPIIIDDLLTEIRENRDGIPESITQGQVLWPKKHNEKELKVLEAGDRFTFATQYQQNPAPLEGALFNSKYWRFYDVLPEISLLRIYGDTAQKTGEHNDYSVFQLWGRAGNDIYLIDQIRGKWEAPELEKQLVAFWQKHKPNQYKPRGAQVVKIEDKSSGSSLIQSIKTNYNIPVEAIQRSRDKVLRCMGVVNYFASGKVYLPKSEPWIDEYVEEFERFSPNMTHRHDDQIDPTVDAVEDLLIFNNLLYTPDTI